MRAKVSLRRCRSLSRAGDQLGWTTVNDPDPTALPREPGGAGPALGARSLSIQRTRVAEVVRVSRSMARITVESESLATFATEVACDASVRLVFTPKDVRPESFDSIRTMQRDSVPFRARDYTIRTWDHAARRMGLDVHLHEAGGFASAWAARVQVGDEICLQGVSGRHDPDPAVADHLFVGDETALPAIARCLESLPPTARGHALIEVDEPGDEQRLAHPPALSLTWVHRGERPVGELLVEQVTALREVPRDAEAFVRGEAGMVASLRRHLRRERRLSPRRLSFGAYWRFGFDDESWRERHDPLAGHGA